MVSNNKMTNYIAIFMLFFFANAGTFMNSAIQTCIDAWPNVPVELIRMLTTLPPAFTTLTLLLAGSLVGKKISYRAMAIIGSILIAVGGIAPFFYAPNWTSVLVFRCILGIGAGCFGMRNALLLESVPADKQTSFTGYGGVLFSLGLVIMAPLVGKLAELGWQYAFLGNTLIIPIGLWLLVFLREPEAVSANADAADKSAGGKERGGSSIAWMYVLMMFMSSFAIYAFHIGISTYLETKRLGTASAAGTVLSSYMIGGILVSLSLTQLQKVFGRFLLPVSFLLIAAGHAMILYIPAMPAVYFGGFLSGCGYMTMYSILQVYNAQVSGPKRMVFFSMMILIGAQVGMFVTPYYITFAHNILKLGTDIESSFLSCIIIQIIVALMALTPKVIPQAELKQDAE